jgi:hypothetical protein
VILPSDMEGTFIWDGKEIPLHGGKQAINFL